MKWTKKLPKKELFSQHIYNERIINSSIYESMLCCNVFLPCKYVYRWVNKNFISHETVCNKTDWIEIESTESERTRNSEHADQVMLIVSSDDETI